MKPVIVNRYSWSIREAVEALLGAEVGDAERWQIRVDGDDLVVDIVAPTSAPALEHAETDIEALHPAGAAAKNAKPPEPERKGGRLARRASIICGEKGFWNFIRERYGAHLVDKEAAAAWMYDRFCVQSRADLDHDAGAAACFRDVDQAYRMWLDGY